MMGSNFKEIVLQMREHIRPRRNDTNLAAGLTSCWIYSTLTVCCGTKLFYNIKRESAETDVLPAAKHVAK
jgi:hypothetical protein